MTELLTAAQMRALEQAAIASGEVTGLELMERAGRGVVEAILDEWPEFREGSHRAVVLCGPGNNGGDGFVVARLLKEAGWGMEVFLYGDAEKLPPDARVNFDRWRKVGKVEEAKAVDRYFLSTGELFVDALFGTGLKRPFPVELEDFHQIARNGIVYGYKTVSVDVPSGLCADSGGILHEARSRSTNDWWAVEADLTVTFHCPKIGHLMTDGPAQCGKLRVIDIGLSTFAGAMRQGRFGQAAREALFPNCWMIDPRAGPFPKARISKWAGQHKYTHGHAFILSGPATRTGASRLAARGALRIGAGLVTVACPPDAVPEHAARLDAIMLRTVPDATALTGLLADCRINAVCIGPGLGLDAHAAALVEAVLRASDPKGVDTDCEELERVSPASGTTPPPPSPLHEGEGGRLPPAAELNPVGIVPNHHPKEAPTPPTTASPPPRGEGLGVGGAAPATPATPNPNRHAVLDADALTLLAQNPTLFAELHANCVLTPHAGEFARLFPDIAARLDATPTTGPAYSKVDATRDAAAGAGCTILFKGPDTVIADPSGRCAINSAHYDHAAPWLATAGSGDVLAGFITGLLARGFQPHDAACTAAWLHVECALSFGPGLIAEDLPEELPKVFRALAV